jgi:thioredoxin-related protein
MTTTQFIDKMKASDGKYRLYELSNVVVARDAHYLLPAFYVIRSMPYMVLYKNKGKLIGTIEGCVDWDKVLASFQKEKQKTPPGFTLKPVALVLVFLRFEIPLQ